MLGLMGRDGPSLPTYIRNALQNATIAASNLAARDCDARDDLAAKSIAVMLSHVFELLDATQRQSLEYDLLLPILYRSPFFCKDSLNSGYFLSSIDSDVVEASPGKFDWDQRATTFFQIKRMESGPLFSSLGSLSRLIAFAVENVVALDVLVNMIQEMGHLARSLCVQWRQNKLSEIDITEESIYLTGNSLKYTVPLLWKVLRSTMFALVIILRSLLGRTIGDPRLATSRGSSCVKFMSIG